LAADPQEQSIGAAVQEISERASLLIREEIELAKAEVSEKVTKLIRGAVVGIAAGIFVVSALLFILHGFAWLAWFELFDQGQFFWGFFLVAGVLLVLGGLAGWIAARAVKSGSPPKPEMAIEEAKLIRASVSRDEPASTGVGGANDSGTAH
jgi:uncharacterized membrane protein YqjE